MPFKYSSRLPELIFDPNNVPMKIEHIPKFEHDNLSTTVKMAFSLRAIGGRGRKCSEEDQRCAADEHRNVPLLSHHQLSELHAQNVLIL